jgi:hypothetical protein
VVLEEGFRLTSGGQGANYDVSLDGRRFLMVKGSDDNLSQLNVVLNWFEELKRRVPAAQWRVTSDEWRAGKWKWWVGRETPNSKFRIRDSEKTKPPLADARGSDNRLAAC